MKITSIISSKLSTIKAQLIPIDLRPKIAMGSAHHIIMWWRSVQLEMIAGQLSTIGIQSNETNLTSKLGKGTRQAEFTMGPPYATSLRTVGWGNKLMKQTNVELKIYISL